MATNIFNYDGTLLTTVADGTLDTTHASIKFPGRGWQNYGEPVLENLLWIMQNFAGNAEPPLPTVGQLWFDTAIGSGTLKIWNGTEWQPAGGVTVADNPPPNPLVGALWYDTINKQLKVYNGTIWDIVGPLGSIINADPIDPGVRPNSVVEAMRVIGVEDGLEHSLWRINIAGIMLAIFSKDQVFTPQSSTLTNGGFPKIYPGINLNTKIAGIGVNGDETIFRSTKTNLPSVNATWNLGSPSKQFNTFYSQSGVFSNTLGVGVTPTSFNFEVGGTSKLGGAVTLGIGTSGAPPIKWTATNPLTTQPQVGAVEFDGNNFYFTGLLNGQPVRRTPLFALNLNETKNLFVSSAAGNDTNDGRSKWTPLKTIKRALDILITNNLSGYTIFVESGEYLEQNPLYVPAKTSIVGDNLRRVIVRPVHNQLDVFHVNTGTYFYGMTIKDHRSPSFAFSFPCSTATATISASSVASVIPTFSYGGYDPANPPEVYIEPPPFDSEYWQATATASIVNGAITDIVLTSRGSGYISEPTIEISGWNNTGSGCTVSPRIDENTDSATYGQLLAIDLTSFGSGYEAPITVLISGGGGTGANATAVVQDGVISSINFATQGDRGAGYIRAPWVSIKPPSQTMITSSPYIQNCSSITGPFDTNGKLITTLPGYWVNQNEPSPGRYLDPNGAGAGIRIDGEILDNDPTGGQTVIRSFVADAFTQINQGGIGHLMLNRGYAQFVSCFTTFSSIGYWARSGGFGNISNSVIDFGDVGLQAEGYYPVPYASGVSGFMYRSTVKSISVLTAGSGFPVNAIFNTTLVGGRGNPASGVAATAQVICDRQGRVSAIRVLTPGSQYETEPTIDWTGAPEAVPGIPPTPPTYKVTLLGPEFVQINGVDEKPQFGSAMLHDGRFYIVGNVVATGSTANWLLATNPPVYAMNQNDGVTFHDISNLSTGGLALEYVGSGVTYNALPYYGGVPDINKQVVDGEDPTSLQYPGRVYYVTIDNTGNFKIGPYFAVNFVDGSVKFNAKDFKISNLDSIGPFQRDNVPVGTYADKISTETALNELIDPEINNDHTIPTITAIRGYFDEMTSNLVAASSNTYVIGSNTFWWNKLYAKSAWTSDIVAESVNITNLNSAISPLRINSANSYPIVFSSSHPTVTGMRLDSSVTTATWSFNQSTGSGNSVPVESMYFAYNKTSSANNGVKLVVTPQGTIGIGTVNPLGTVDIISETDNVNVNALTRGVNRSSKVVVGAATSNTTITTTTGGISSIQGNCSVMNVGTFSAADLNLVTSNTNRVTISATGNVGINSSLPTNTIHISKDVSTYNVPSNTSLPSVFIKNTNNTTRQAHAFVGMQVGGSNAGCPFISFDVLNTGGWSVGIDNSDLGKFKINSSNLGVDNNAFNKITIDTNGRVGIGTATPLASSKLDVVGSVNIRSNLNVRGDTVIGVPNTSPTFYCYGDIIGFYTSDERLKTNIVAINNALIKVSSLNGVTFDWNEEAKSRSSYKDKREAGLIAQQVESVLPEVVTTRDDGFKAVDYQKVVPLLVEAIKELKLKVEALEQKIN